MLSALLAAAVPAVDVGGGEEGGPHAADGASWEISAGWRGSWQACTEGEAEEEDGKLLCTRARAEAIFRSTAASVESTAERCEACAAALSTNRCTEIAKALDMSAGVSSGASSCTPGSACAPAVAGVPATVVHAAAAAVAVAAAGAATAGASPATAAFGASLVAKAEEW